MTIRAYGVQKQFDELFLIHVDQNGAWWNAFIVSSRWLGLRLDLMCTLLVLGGIVLAIILKDQVCNLCHHILTFNVTSSGSTAIERFSHQFSVTGISTIGGVRTCAIIPCLLDIAMGCSPIC